MAEKREGTTNISVRLPDDMLATLELIAAGERSTVSAIIRLAIEKYLNPEQKESA